VNPAVELDHQPMAMTGEVGDVSAEGDLSTEVEVGLAQSVP
jgi:hypothetical protein